MKISNKTAPGAFAIEERIEAGIALLGSEVKALRLGHADISGAYVKIIGSEAYLINAKIYPYKYSRIEGYQEDRTRKLLMHKRELLAIKSKLDQGKLTLVPTILYDKGSNFKIEVALARGLKQHERRKNSKQQALKRANDRDLKNVR